MSEKALFSAGEVGVHELQRHERFTLVLEKRAASVFRFSSH
ncbi:MAG: hypothetical protein OEM05_05610 [Myxococcales bacterium]|nr:hypothetical protein [Myxococcales bacterium]